MTLLSFALGFLIGGLAVFFSYGHMLELIYRAMRKRNLL